MKPKIIQTEADYETALARIDVLMDGDPEPTSAAGEDLELLCLLVGNYEAIHYPICRIEGEGSDPLNRQRLQSLRNPDPAE